MGWLDEDGPKAGSKLGVGRHVVTVARIATAKKDGSQMLDKQGNPQFVVTLEAANGELDWWCPIIGKLTWKLSALVKAALMPHEVKTLREQNIEPHHFMDASLAESWLKGRTLVATGVQDGRYVNFELSPYDPMAPDLKPPKPLAATKAESNDVPFDDVPF
jgi:hypothetical protein